jgi:hypothetical protein
MKSNEPVTREERWKQLANEPNSNLPKEVRDFIKRSGGKGVEEKFGLQLAHPPKRANAQGYDYREALPKHRSDHATQHRYLREHKHGTIIRIPKKGRTGTGPMTRPPPIPEPKKN